MYDDFEFALHNTYIGFHFFYIENPFKSLIRNQTQTEKKIKRIYLLYKIPMYISFYQIPFLLASLKHYQKAVLFWLTLIYAAVGLYDSHSLNGFFS